MGKNKHKDTADILLLFILISCVLFVSICFKPYIAHAEVVYENQTFTQSVILKRANQPYYFTGQNTIPKGVMVTVEKGTQIFIEGSIFLRGKLVFQGEKDVPILVTRSPSSQGYQKLITVMGGEFSATHTKFQNTSGLLDAYSTSTVLFDAIDIENIHSSNGSSAITVFNSSLLSIKNSSFKDVTSSYGIDIFNQSTLNILNTSFEHVGTQGSIRVFDAQIYPQAQSGINGSSTTPTSNPYRVNSTASISETSFDSGLVAIEIFNGAYAEINLARFENFESAGISGFAEARLEILNTIFSKNKNGIESYNSFIKISESEIFGNTEHGALLYGGEVNASNNWWGSESGPRSINLNPSGTGDIYAGIGQVSPWKTSKPAKKVKCCSSILFIPGIQGSRIYKKGVTGETQLWEPNSTSDISKLYLTTDGYSIDKSLYFRDIIDRTNIVFGGNDDIEVYKGLMQALNGLNSNYSIEDWQFAAYDWRLSPNSVVTEGTRYGTPTGSYKKMEDQILQMAPVSKTGKVTLIAHSYGGLVMKRFLAYLVQKGKIGLVDKVILVGVPENGAPSALFALLHGDNQDIGNGYIVNKFTMRKFAQNMPAVYALLPKVDSTLIYGLQATNTIATAVPTISSVPELYKFLFKEIPRPSTSDPIEINIPLIANKKVKQKIDIESSPGFIRSQFDPAFNNVEFYNILGIGLNTPESISYTKKPCISLYTLPALMSPNCGLDHTLNQSQFGDGTVFADDVLFSKGNTHFLPTATSTTMRWGEKYLFNIAEYNRKNNKNYTHASMISAPPIISTLMQIMLNNIGTYSLPIYMTRHGGPRMGGIDVELQDSSTGPTTVVGSIGSTITEAERITLISDIAKNKIYKISASDAVLISARDSIGQVMGMNFAMLSSARPINPTSSSVVPLKSSQIIPVKNTAPNSSAAHVGDAYYIHTETLPSYVSLIPNLNIVSNTFIHDQNPGGGTVEIDFKIEEISQIINQGNGDITLQYDTKTVASFENIPITEYSKIEISINSGLGQSTQVEMKVVDRYEDVYSNTSTYIADSIHAPYISSEGSQSSLGSIDIGYLIGIIRAEIQASGVRANFKQRYVLKLNTVEKNYKSIVETKKRLARIYAKDTTASLMAIVKDLNRSRALYYRGGMRKSEVAFLLYQFSRLSRAFGD